MLQVIEQTPRRLVLRDQRSTAGLVALVFVALSVSGALTLLLQLVTGFSERIGRFDGPYWLLGMVVFLLLALGFVGLGLVAAVHFLVGVTCVLDKDRETVVIRQAGVLRPQQREVSIYAVSHIDVEHNIEVHAFGVFLVLRHYERVPVASFHQQDEDAMRALVKEMRAFLRGD